MNKFKHVINIRHAQELVNTSKSNSHLLKILTEIIFMIIHWVTLLLVLVMANGSSRSPPLLLDFQGLNSTILTATWARDVPKTNRIKIYLGNVQRDFKLNFGKGTEVWGSCGATLNGQHWIIGGSNKKRQVSDQPKKQRKFKGS